MAKSKNAKTPRAVDAIHLLTNGERLLVARRRRDETQNDAAKRMKLSAYTYRRLELDEPVEPARQYRGAPQIGQLREHEALFLMRVRLGLQIGELAKRMGCAREWLSRMERGVAPVARLRDWWMSDPASRATRDKPPAHSVRALGHALGRAFPNVRTMADEHAKLGRKLMDHVFPAPRAKSGRGGRRAGRTPRATRSRAARAKRT